MCIHDLNVVSRLLQDLVSNDDEFEEKCLFLEVTGGRNYLWVIHANKTLIFENCI